MTWPPTSNRPFRNALKASALASALGFSADVLDLSSQAVAWPFRISLLLLALAAIMAILACISMPGRSLTVRLFAPGIADRLALYRLVSFLSVADPRGEAQQQGPAPRKDPSLSFSVLLYCVLVIPSAFLVDWIAHRGARLTLAAIFYLAPWVAIRSLEERARRRARAFP